MIVNNFQDKRSALEISQEELIEMAKIVKFEQKIDYQTVVYR